MDTIITIFIIILIISSIHSHWKNIFYGSNEETSLNKKERFEQPNFTDADKEWAEWAKKLRQSERWTDKERQDRDREKGRADRIKRHRENEQARQYKARAEKEKQDRERAEGEARPNRERHHKHRIINCPTCRQKIRITLPFHKGTGRCIKCTTRFSLIIEGDNAYIEKIPQQEKPNYSEGELSMDDCYHILGVNKNSSLSEIKKSYRSRLNKYHPDKVANLGEEIKKVANLESKKLIKAYAILKDKIYA